MTENSQLPLAGVKVIDLTLARAGPTTVRHLADWGADVIRIEPPPAPGEAPTEDVVGSRTGSDYQNLHRNKRLLQVNLKHPDGIDVLKDLVRGADVLVENMRPSVKDRLGISYEGLSLVNPQLVYGSISGFGQAGPYRDRPGVDQIIQGMSGMMSVTGLPDGGPLRAGIAVADLTAGNALALAIMMALFDRSRSGRGRWVHTSLLESQIFMMDFQAARWLSNGEVAQRMGNGHPTVSPVGVFASSDGQINISASSSRQWTRLCAALGSPQWLEVKEWQTGKGRASQRAQIAQAVERVTRTRPSSQWIETLNAAGIPCGPIYTMNEVFADEQVQLLKMAATVDEPAGGHSTMVASPLNFEGAQKKIRRKTPAPGQDTVQILRELGYDETKIARLRKSTIN